MQNNFACTCEMYVYDGRGKLILNEVEYSAVFYAEQISVKNSSPGGE